MILTCPNCGTQYVVKDGAIPPEGRQVRCASCKHSWHQEPDEISDAPAQEAAAAPVQPEPEANAPVESVETPAGEREAEAPADESPADESLAEATLIEPRSGPEAEERAFEEATADAAATAPAEAPEQVTAGDEAAVAAEEPRAVYQDDGLEPPQAEEQPDDFRAYAAPDEVSPKRKSPVRAIFGIVLLVIIVAAGFWFLAPADMKAKLGLAGTGNTPLALVTTHMDRQRLESGNELLTVTGRVINPTSKNQPVPPLQAQLKTKAGKVVYSWTIAPPAPSLAPGESKSFNSAEVSVPPGGEELTITLGGTAAG